MLLRHSKSVKPTNKDLSNTNINFNIFHVSYLTLINSRRRCLLSGGIFCKVRKVQVNLQNWADDVIMSHAYVVVCRQVQKPLLRMFVGCFVAK